MLSLSSTSSSDDNDSEIIEYITRQRRRTNLRIDHMLLEDSDFLCRYRITKNTAHYICRCIQREVQSNTPRNNAMSVSDQLLITLRFYATCSMQLVVGDINKVHKASVCRAIHRVSRAIAALAPRYIYMPRNSDEMSAVSNEFYRIANFPRVIGAIDCTHVPIQSPGTEQAELYRCRKGFFSLNVQTVVDAKLRIMDIVCRWPGSVHDTTIFDNSYIRERMENEEFGRRHLIADGGYPQRNYIMTPFRSPNDNAEENYNRSHIRTGNTALEWRSRITKRKVGRAPSIVVEIIKGGLCSAVDDDSLVERSYGVWKRRFPCIGLKLRVHRKNMEAIVVATAVLYNICRELNEVDNYEDFDLPIEEQPVGLQNSHTSSGVTVRNDLVRDFFSNV